MTDIRKDLLSSSKALLDLDADGALVPHGIGGLARACLSWGIDEIEHLRADNERLREALVKISNSVHGSFDDAHVMADIARAALEDGKDD